MLFIAIHPAPYIDIWIENIKQKYLVSVAYNYEKSAAKTWKSYKPVSGIIINNYGLIGWTRKIAENDIIILNGWNKLYNIYTLFIALFLKKKVAVFSDYPIEVRKGTLKWLCKSVFLHLLVPRILCATHSTCKYYQDVFAYKLDNTIFFPYATKNEPLTFEFNLQRENLLKTGDRIKVFVANNFRVRKGYDVLLNALLLLEKEILTKMILYVAGSGDLLKEYSLKISKIVPNVELLGWIEDNEYSTLMKECDLFIHASTFEPFGIPPIDAMKYGKLVVVSDGVKSLSDIIVNGENGYIFHAGNSKELAQILSKVISHKESVYEIGRRGKCDICSIYNNKFVDNLDF